MPKTKPKPKAKSPKVAVGDVVEIEFLDHVEDGDEPLRFLVWGRVDRKSRKHIEIVSWTYADRKSASGDHNEKRWTIVSSTISRIEILKTT